VSFDDSHLEYVPHVLYRFYDDERRLLYIGISANFGRRLDKHLRDKPWFCRVANIAVQHFTSRTAALEAERRAIVTEKPLHNVAHGGGERDPFRGLPRHIVRLPERPVGEPEQVGAILARPVTGAALRGDEAALALVQQHLAVADDETPRTEVRSLMYDKGSGEMQYDVGGQLEHEHFGFGIILRLWEGGAGPVAEVQFAIEHGCKRLFLKYAPVVPS
jgi:predicted GIY-YIG superfamily endonuclease